MYILYRKRSILTSSRSSNYPETKRTFFTQLCKPDELSLEPIRRLSRGATWQSISVFQLKIVDRMPYSSLFSLYLSLSRGSRGRGRQRRQRWRRAGRRGGSAASGGGRGWRRQGRPKMGREASASKDGEEERGVGVTRWLRGADWTRPLLACLPLCPPVPFLAPPLLRASLSSSASAAAAILASLVASRAPPLGLARAVLASEPREKKRERENREEEEEYGISPQFLIKTLWIAAVATLDKTALN